MLERHAIVILAALLPMTIVPAAADMKYPDMQSQWRNPTAGRGGNPWDPNKPMGLGQQAPLTPEYQTKFEASLKAQKEGSQGNSRGSTCEIAGMPKMMNFAEPMEIVIRPNIFYFIPVQVPTRRIYTDGRTFPKDAPPTLGGYSIGRWIDEDGDGRYDCWKPKPAISRARVCSSRPACPSTTTTRPSSRSASISTRATATFCTTR